jgi:hypothetical protein
MAKAFETYRLICDIRSQGRHTGHFNKITAPEFLIIQSIHGKGSLQIKEKQGDDVETRLSETGKWLQRIRTSESLQEKLISKYTEAVFKKVFPGENPVLPYTYEDANLLSDQVEGETDNDGWEEVKPFVNEEPTKKDKPLTIPAKGKTDTDMDFVGSKKA